MLTRYLIQLMYPGETWEAWLASLAASYGALDQKHWKDGQEFILRSKVAILEKKISNFKISIFKITDFLKAGQRKIRKERTKYKRDNL